MRPAVFLDRDGTLIEQVHYLNRVDQVRLIPGAAATLRALSDAGFATIVVTNQAAIGKGLLTEEGLRAIQAELDRQLAAHGARLDDWYFSPHTRGVADRETVEHPDRKPGPGMLLRAAEEHDLDVARSWMVGDMVSDTLAGRNAGVLGTILVRTGKDTPDVEAHPSVDHVVDAIDDILPIVIGEGGERA